MKEEKKNSKTHVSCPPCVEPIMKSICKLLPPERQGECRRRFFSQSPEDFVKWLKSLNISTEQFLKALEEGLES